MGFKGLALRFEIPSDELRRMAETARCPSGFPDAVVRAFMARLQFIRAAKGVADICCFQSLKFRRPDSGAEGCGSVRLTDEYRLVLDINEKDGDTVLVLKSIEGSR